MTELRKHRLQMQPVEIRSIEEKIHAANWSRILQLELDHALERLLEKNISPNEVLDSLQTGEVIEAKLMPWGEFRFVMRKNEVAAVVALYRGRKKFVTAWRNHILDNHASLNLKSYTWKARFV